MKMNKEKYESLIRRFSEELYEVGVTDLLTQLIRDTADRVPNQVAITNRETTDRFVYQHDGYKIEATREVVLTVKKCK